MALVPPPSFHLTRFHGVFAPNARLRPRIVPPPPEPEVPEPVDSAPLPAKPKARRRSAPVPWAELLQRSFGTDVLTCHLCGAPRRVLAFVSRVSEARRFLTHLGLHAQLPEPLPHSTGPPQLTFLPEPHFA